MSNDRELLELAAKAAGYSIEQHVNYKHSPHLMFALNGKNWNPLTDDGDALRLACTLGLAIGINNPFHMTLVADLNGNSRQVSHSNCGTAAATRRAIVRAAAEIGRAMP